MSSTSSNDPYEPKFPPRVYVHDVSAKAMKERELYRMLLKRGDKTGIVSEATYEMLRELGFPRYTKDNEIMEIAANDGYFAMYMRKEQRIIELRLQGLAKRVGEAGLN